MSELAPMSSGEDGGGADVTLLLNEACAGDARAAADLLPLVYDRLRELAGRRMRSERADQTLQATALVHEAYVRLVDSSRLKQWDGRWHFFAAAAEAMRRILVEQARRRGRMKRGAGMRRVELDAAELTVDEPPEDMIGLDEALAKLEAAHPERARLVKLRYFGGLTIEEACAAMGIGATTAERYWTFARAWLYREMGGESGDDGRP